MERLNEYLQKLLSSCSDELHLEPNKNPYLIQKDRTSDVGQVPLLGTQISTMVFPIIPPDVKRALPSSDEIEFVHTHPLGRFNFIVRKSPSGFLVTVRPLMKDASQEDTVSALADMLPPEPPPIHVGYTAERPSPFASMEERVEASLPKPSTTFDLDQPNQFEPAPAYVPEAAPVFESAAYEIESASATYDTTSSLEVDSVLTDLLQPDLAAAAEYVPTATPGVDIVSAYDPSFQTVFSDTAPDIPLRRSTDFLGDEYTPAGEADLKIEFSDPQNFMEYQPTSPVETFAPQAAPAAQSFVPPPAMDIPPAFRAEASNPVMREHMDSLFRAMAAMGASDLHLSVSMSPMVRKDGKMKPMNSDSPLTPESMRDLLTSIMPPKNQEEFSERHDTDFAYEIPGLARFRCNVFMDRKGMGAVFRIIPSKILTAQDLGLSKAIMDLCSLSKGLVVVTGPTGSGKSTTLCAMVDSINKTREDHIITIEDPIEFVHENHKCLVNQREVHNHTDSFKDALRAALREDPDILLVGEMRDLETISIAIETAETGHLVFGTLHTTTAASTVDRIIDQFPADRQQQIRVMLSESLKGVIAQTLLPKKGGGRVAALEILVVTPAISNLIREGKTFQIPSAMQTGKNHGMVMLNDALMEHVSAGRVEPLDAYMKAVDKTGFETALSRAGIKI